MNHTELSSLGRLARIAKIAAARGVAGAGERAAQAGIKIPQVLPPPLNGIGTTLKRGWRMNKPMLKRAAVGGLVDGAVVGGVLYVDHKIRQSEQERQDKAAARRARARRQLAAKLNTIMLARGTPALHRVVDAAESNLPQYELPYRSEIGIAKKVWRSDLARAARLRAARIALLTGAGAYAGHKLLKPKSGWKIGAGIGATAGVLFDASPSMQTPEQIQKTICAEIERTHPAIRRGAVESHSPESLAKRLGVPVTKALALCRDGTLTPREIVQNGTSRILAFDSDALNNLVRAHAAESAASAIELHAGDLGSARDIELAAKIGLREFASHRTGPDGRYLEKEDPSLASRVGKAAAIAGTGAAVVGGASWLRGRSVLGRAGARDAGVLGTAKAGFGRLRTDATRGGSALADLLAKGKQRLAAR
jgi:hypothetical protein